jgi:hypothetical protein
MEPITGDFPTEIRQTPDIVSSINTRDFEILAFAGKTELKIEPGISFEPKEGLSEGFFYPDTAAINEKEAEFQKAQNEKARALELHRETPPPRTIVGIRELKINGDIISFNTKPLTDALQYDPDLGLTAATQEGNRLREELGSPLGIAIALITKDGKMLIQHRSTENRTYKDIIQGSAGGFLTQDLDETRDGALKPVDADHVRKIVSEMVQRETGIDQTCLRDIKITGVAVDKKRVHHELLHIGKVDLTAAEAIEMASKNTPKAYNEIRSDIREQFIAIDATPANILKLLTEVTSPISPTHTALFFAALKSIVSEQEGEVEAKKWMDLARSGLQKNISVQDNIVKRATEGRENSYNPTLFLEEQGFPSMEDELRRTGLAEGLRRPRYVFFWDCDGPIVDPIKREITEAGFRIIKTIGTLIDKGYPQILNTGRAVEWLAKEGKHNVIGAISDAVLDKNKLADSLHAIGEFGGSRLFYENGSWWPKYNMTAAVPDNIQQEIKDAIDNNPDYNQYACFEEGKHVQLSITQPDGADLDDYLRIQPNIVKEIQKILAEHGNPHFELLVTGTGTDLCPPGFGKGLGAEIGDNWLKENNIRPWRVGIVGDSPTDLAMAKKLQERYGVVDSYYVGKPEKLTDEHKDELKRTPYVTEKPFNEGTLEVLESLLASGWV